MRTAVKDIKETKPYATRRHYIPYACVSLRQTTKTMLNKYRAPGQSYDGFIYQLIDMWEKNNGKYAI